MSSLIDQHGYAPPLAPPDVYRGSALHERVASLVGDARPQGPWRRYRGAFLDRFRMRKILWIVRQRGSLRRIANFLIYFLERGRIARVHYEPVNVSLEPGNLCNLKCPGCVTGGRNGAARARRWATPEAMKSSVDEVAATALQLQIFHWGEPLMNPHVLDVAAYAVSKGLWTSIHSNLSLDIPDLAERIVASRLCNLVVSVDGATQEVYSRYRVGGDVELVLANIERIAKEKRRRGRQLPWITAKFIVFDHNWHEAADLRVRALESGADEVLFVGGLKNVIHQSGRVAAEHEFDVVELKYVPRRLGKGCRELWEGMSFDHDGAVYPCCDAFRDEDLFVGPEEAGTKPIGVHWNSDPWYRARRFFTNRSAENPSELPSPCDRCERVRLHGVAQRS